MDNRQQLVSAPRVAERLGLAVSRVYDLSREGLIPHVRIGRQTRFDPQQVERWIANGGTKETST